ncbi:MAG: methionyl-tRNA formyltransferase [Prevotellaceae bacterium]|jgi:methionyl-tRNA formyltransferase|nr:methionyl-tRNA formyltransferase [Prevotellaceae bacterium]
MRIIFMGTPDFAVQSLKSLVEGGYNIVTVVTMPDKPAGRGHKIQYSPVKKYAIEKNLPLLQPEKLKDETFLAELKALNGDLQIVVAFRMLPQAVWAMPKHGTFNLHASLLPHYRGAAPINWAIINGEKETGVTTFFLAHEIDTGEIILRKKITIAEDDNAGIVHDKLMDIGAQLVVRTVDLIAQGKADTTKQSEYTTENTALKSAPKIFKDTCKIDFTKSVEAIHNFVRGLSPYPAAWTEITFPQSGEAVTLKVYETEKEIQPHNEVIGTVFTDKKSIKIASSDGFVLLKSVQLAGKKRMSVEELLRGLRRF